MEILNSKIEFYEYCIIIINYYITLHIIVTITTVRENKTVESILKEPV
jgi:hypothetical protein